MREDEVKFCRKAAAVGIAIAVATATSGAQVLPEPAGTPAVAKPGILSEIGIDQRLHAQGPLALTFTDESGRQVRLGDYFGKRAGGLAPGYFGGPVVWTPVLN